MVLHTKHCYMLLGRGLALLKALGSRLCLLTFETLTNLREQCVIWKQWSDLMLSARQYNLCSWVAEFKITISGAMSVQHASLNKIRIVILFWRAKLSLHHYPLSSAHDLDLHDVGWSYHHYILETWITRTWFSLSPANDPWKTPLSCWYLLLSLANDPVENPL